MLGIYFRFRRHSGHGRTFCWLAPVANDPKPSSLHLRNCLIGARLDALSLHHEAKRTNLHIER